MAEAPVDGGSAGGTQFTSMSHEQMLEWLDQARSGEVQAAADKLTSAAKEINKIAAELKVRPQWVTWKGEGADAFREWAGKLANATLGLGDFTEGSGKWLGEAANAISTAQASIPRDKKSAQANLDAAHAAHNDPDSRSVASKSSGELAAIAADKEKVRLEAAGHMEKLGQALSLSSGQMDQLAESKPKFPPPTPFVPKDDIRDSSEAYGGGGTGDSARAGAVGTGVGAGTGASGHVTASSPSTTPVEASRPPSATPAQSAPTVDEGPTRMGIDTVGTLPETPQAQAPSAAQPATGPTANGPGAVPPSAIGTVSPVSGGQRGTFSPGRATGTPSVGRGISATGGTGGTARPGTAPAAGATGRPSAPGTRGPITGGTGAAATGRPASGGTAGRMPTSGGVAGGRPQATTGRPTTGLPRGTVVGGEGATGARGATGGSTSSTSARGTAAGRSVGSTGAKGGVVGGRTQQSGRGASRSFSPGGSGLVRGQGGSAAASEAAHSSGRSGRGGMAPGGGSRPGKRQDEQGGERPDYLVEDEETWQPDDSREVPSVVDNTPKQSER